MERYHADYSPTGNYDYLADGGELAVIPMPHPSQATDPVSAVAAAVQQSQQNEHTYLDFIRKTRCGATRPDQWLTRDLFRGEMRIGMWSISRQPRQRRGPAICTVPVAAFLSSSAALRAYSSRN